MYMSSYANLHLSDRVVQKNMQSTLKSFEIKNQESIFEKEFAHKALISQQIPKVGQSKKITPYTARP